MQQALLLIISQGIRIEAVKAGHLGDLIRGFHLSRSLLLTLVLYEGLYLSLIHISAFGSGAGNATVIIDETANCKEAAMNTRISKTSDFGSGCSCDGNLVIHESVFDEMVACLQAEGGYLATPEEAEKLKLVMWDAEGHRLPQTVAIAPQKLAEAAGFSIPADRKFIMVMGLSLIHI